MTQITTALTRETRTQYRGEPLVVELHPGFMVLRRKGRREKFSLPYDAAFEAAMRLSYLQNRSET